MTASTSSSLTIVFVSYLTSTLATILFSVSCATNWWIFTRNFWLNKATKTSYTAAHFGLWQFCIDVESEDYLQSGCHAVSASCKSDVGFGDFTLIGLREFGHCQGFNVTRAFVIMACISSGIAFLFHGYGWAANNTKAVLVSLGCHIFAAFSGIIAMSVFLAKMYYGQDADSSYFTDLHYSFVLLILGWIFSSLTVFMIFFDLKSSHQNNVFQKRTETAPTTTTTAGTMTRENIAGGTFGTTEREKSHDKNRLRDFNYADDEMDMSSVHDCEMSPIDIGL